MTQLHIRETAKLVTTELHKAVVHTWFGDVHVTGEKKKRGDRGKNTRVSTVCWLVATEKDVFVWQKNEVWGRKPWSFFGGLFLTLFNVREKKK